MLTHCSVKKIYNGWSYENVITLGSTNKAVTKKVRTLGTNLFQRRLLGKLPVGCT